MNIFFSLNIVIDNVNTIEFVLWKLRIDPHLLDYPNSGTTMYAIWTK